MKFNVKILFIGILFVLLVFWGYNQFNNNSDNVDISNMKYTDEKISLVVTDVDIINDVID